MRRNNRSHDTEMRANRRGGGDDDLQRAIEVSRAEAGGGGDREGNRGGRLGGEFPALFRNKIFLISMGIMCGVGILMMLIMLPESFSYVNWDELAFQKNTLSNTVDRETVYTNGRYFWGLSTEPLTFPSIYQKISYRGNDLLVFAGSGDDANNTAQAGLEFGIECDVFYRLQPENLKEIFNDFGTAYHERFVDSIKASIKNTAPEFTVDDYILRRQDISERMREEINHDIQNLNLQIDEHKFVLLSVHFPARLLNKFEATVMKDLEIDKSVLDRDVDLYQKGTEEAISRIRANITLINSTTDARVAAIIAQGNAQAEAIDIEAKARARAIELNAQAESVRIQEEALGIGVSHMMKELNVTAAEMSKLFQLLTILDSPSGRILIGDEDNLIHIGE